MRVQSIELYLLPSLSRVVDVDPLFLIDTPHGRASLTKFANDAILHVRRRISGGVMIAASLMGGKLADQSVHARFNAIFDGPSGQLPSNGDGTLLVVDCEGELPDRSLQHVINLDDFAISLDAEVGDVLSGQTLGVRNAALSAIALSGSDGLVHDARLLGSTIIIYEIANGRPTYVINPKVIVKATVKSALLPDQAAKAIKLARALHTSPKNLRHVPRLLAQSYEKRLQPLSAFISAWAALEILIVVTFREYEAAWTTAIATALPSNTSSVAARIRTIMKDKYRLADKFTIMANSLDPNDASKDIFTFIKLKSIRDDFFHTLAVDPSDLPGDETRRLLRKYLSLHLQKT